MKVTDGVEFLSEHKLVDSCDFTRVRRSEERVAKQRLQRSKTDMSYCQDETKIKFMY